MSKELTMKEVRRRIEDIRASAGDPEGAHGMQDELYLDVLKAVAASGWVAQRDRAVRLAQAVLVVEDIEFPRWMA